MIKNITLTDFKRILNTSHLHKQFNDEYYKYNFNYTELTNDDLQSTLINIIQTITNDPKKCNVPEREDVWKIGWQEALDEFRDTKALSSLVPKYIDRENIHRFNHKLIKATSVNFELNILTLLQIHLFLTYFQEVNNIYEFGAGSCNNIAKLCTMFPDKMIHGTDFVKPPVDLIEELKNHFKFNVKGNLFDITNPNKYSDFSIKENSGILTIGALEQTSDKYKEFIQYLIQQRPKICVHSEPIEEIYDLNNAVDLTGYYFHTKRNYLKGFLTYMRELEKDNKIKILNITRTTFGTKFFENHNIIVWEPV